MRVYAPHVEEPLPLMVRASLLALAWVTGWCAGSAFVLAGAL